MRSEAVSVFFFLSHLVSGQNSYNMIGYRSERTVTQNSDYSCEFIVKLNEHAGLVCCQFTGICNGLLFFTPWHGFALPSYSFKFFQDIFKE